MFSWCPRPLNDNGIGMHDDGVSGPGTMPRMYSLIDQMQDKRFHWLTLVMNVTREKLPLIRYAQDRDIMVLVRPFEQPCHPRSRMQEDWVKACMDHGAHYFIDWNEPNLGGVECNKPYNEYKYAGVPDGHEAFVNRLLDQWLADADTVRKCGGIPLLFPMSPTAYTSNDVYFHRRLYRELIALAKQRGCLDWAFEGTGIAIHNRPCDGMLLDKDDRCAFRDYEWIEKLFSEALERPIPLFGTESGYESGMVDKHLMVHHGIHNPDRMLSLEWHKRLNHEIFARMNPAHPKAWKPYLICQNMWLSHDGPASWPGSGWKLNQWALGEAPAWRDMHELPYFTRAEGTDVDPDPVDPDPIDIEFVGLTDEMIERLTLSGPDDSAQPYWKIYRVEIQATTDNMSAFAVLPRERVGEVMFRWPSGSQLAWPKHDEYAPVGAKDWAASMPMFNAWGGYSVEVQDNSEAIHGFGLYGDNLELTHTAHHPVLVYFAWVNPNGPEPEPDPDIPYTLKRRLEMAPHGYKDFRMQVAEVSDMEAVRLASLQARRIDSNGNPLFGNLTQIVLHHLGGQYFGPINMVEWEINENTEIDHDTSPYHFLIERSGRICWLVAVKYLTHHALGANIHGIGIVFEDEANEKQMEAGRFLIASLYEFFGAEGWGSFRLTGLIPHRMVWNGETWHTSCPGEVWPRILWSGSWPKLKAPVRL